jgi:SCAN domain
VQNPWVDNKDPGGVRTPGPPGQLRRCLVDVTTPLVGVDDDIEIMKMKLQMEQEFKLREFDILDKQREFDRLERDKQSDLEERERDKQRDHELKMAQLKVQSERGLPSDSKAVPQFRVDSAAKLLPKLASEQETETFLITFEKIANLNKWPKEHWAAVLQTQLKGKGLKVFSELSFQESKDYGKLKKEILRAYELCSAVYRKRFRTSKKVSTKSHSDFAFDVTQSFKRWLISVKSWDDIELLKETFLKEQFMESVPTDIKMWLTDRDPKSLEEMAKLADQFVTLRKAISPAEQYQECLHNMLISARPFVKSTRPWIKPNVPVDVDKVVESPVEKRNKLYSRSDLSQVRCF